MAIRHDTTFHENLFCIFGPALVKKIIRHCHKPFSQWQNSFHLKAVLSLAESLVTVSDHSSNTATNRSISQCIKYPIMHHFVTEICTHMHISVKKKVHCGIWDWYIVVFVRWIYSQTFVIELKSCKTSLDFLYDFNNPVRSQFCTCHNSSAVVTFMCKIVSWSDHHFLSKSNRNFLKIWIMS